MRRIIGYIKPYGWRMLWGLSIKFIGTITELALPWILAHMIDVIAPTGDWSMILLWGLAMVVCSLIALMGNIIANRRAVSISRDVTRTLRHDLFNKTERLTMPPFGATLTPIEIRSVIEYLKTMWTPEQRAFQRSESRDASFPPEARQ